MMKSYEQMTMENTAKILNILEEQQRQKIIKNREIEWNKKNKKEYQSLVQNHLNETQNTIDFFNKNGFECQYMNDCFIISKNNIRLMSFSSPDIKEHILKQIIGADE